VCALAVGTIEINAPVDTAKSAMKKIAADLFLLKNILFPPCLRVRNN
jgi:hypothetical protein